MHHTTLGGLQDNTKSLKIYNKVARSPHGDYKDNILFKTSHKQRKKPSEKSKLSSSCSYPISSNSSLRAFLVPSHISLITEGGEWGVSDLTGLFQPWYLWVLPLDLCSSVLLSFLEGRILLHSPCPEDARMGMIPSLGKMWPV